MLMPRRYDHRLAPFSDALALVALTRTYCTFHLTKLQGVPLQCSVFLTRHPTLLTQANSLNAEYLFQNDKYYDASYDSGDKSIQCGRKVDSLKLTLALLARYPDF